MKKCRRIYFRGRATFFLRVCGSYLARHTDQVVSQVGGWGVSKVMKLAFPSTRGALRICAVVRMAGVDASDISGLVVVTHLMPASVGCGALQNTAQYVRVR